MAMAILAGDPEKTGSAFIIRFRTTRDVEVGPHWHPGDEHVTVIQGSYKVGYGEKYDTGTLQDFPPGSYVQIRKTMIHFAWYGSGTVIQVNGIGPYRTFYV